MMSMSLPLRPQCSAASVQTRGLDTPLQCGNSVVVCEQMACAACPEESKLLLRQLWHTQSGNMTITKTMQVGGTHTHVSLVL